jgi:hypothetical protein
MNKESKEKYILLTENKSFEDLIVSLKDNLSKYSSENVIVDIRTIEMTESDLIKIQSLSEAHKENGMSFVTVASNLSADDVDETFAIAPTMQEAEDIITMEDLERELGF